RDEVVLLGPGVRVVDGVFFFQAEDGIRDGHVTGVQTCALPICPAFFDGGNILPNLQSPPQNVPPIEECWATIDGARVRYQRAGCGAPLVLVHGLLGYSFSWRFNIPALAKYATVY